MAAMLFPTDDWIGAFEHDGFAVLANVVPPEVVADLLELSRDWFSGQQDGLLQRDGEVYGARDLLWRVSEVRHLAASPALLGIARAILGPEAFAVRGLFFDKTQTTNWNLPWHQDMTIAVRARCDVPGFGPWTLKAGVPHVLAPAFLLARRVTIRLHLDPCGPQNGPMRVIPGSHHSGRLDPSAIAAWACRAARQPVDCLSPSGGVVVMRPLLLHASSSGTAPGHRRVIHLEYAAEALPDGLEWYEPRGKIV
jgi:ectoine hydroxylase-related dioxygenase (phytanoyl-CoA dioxygenase family)